jgi:hypothetical protein
MDRDRAALRRRRIVERLPPLEDVVRGSVVVRLLRCGKPGCSCASGEGHRAVYLSVTHPGGRTEQISLPSFLVPVVERQVANYQAWWKAIEQISAINRDLIRDERRSRAVHRKSKRRSSRS